MTTKKVVFEKLVLEGFRTYKDRTVFSFSKDINIFVGENEKGKTSMLLGIISVIFGLVSSQNKEEIFSKENSRNRSRPVDFYGQLTFLCDTIRYRIERDFETNLVEVFKKDETRDFHCILKGEHNPNARRSFREYEKLVEDIFIIGSRDLFFETFFVMQPLPETDRVDSKLQSILAGGKNESFSESINVLIDEIKMISKYTGPNDLNVTSRNMTKDGVLEELKNRLQIIEQDLSKGRQTADELVRTMNKDEDVKTRLETARRERKRIKDLLDSLYEWKRLQAEYKSANVQSSEYKKKLEQIFILKNRLEKTYEGIKIKYPHFWGRGEDVKDKLSRHTELVKRLLDVEKNIEELSGEIHVLNENRKALLEKDESGLEKLLGNSPIENLKIYRDAGMRFIDDLEHFMGILDEIKKLDGIINEKYFLIHNLEKYEKNIFRTWPYEKDRIEENTKKALEKLGLLKNKQAEYYEKKEEIREKYGLVADLDARGEESLRRRSGLLDIKNKINDQIENQRKRLKSSKLYLLSLLLIMVPAYFAYITGNIHYLIPGVFTGIIWAAYLFFSNRKIYIKDIKTGEDRIKEINDELAGTDPNILLNELKNFRLETGYFEEAFKKPSDEEILSAEKEFEEILKIKNSFEGRFLLYEKTYGDLAEAYETYTRLAGKRENLNNRAAEYHCDIFGVLDKEISNIYEKPGVRDSFVFCSTYLRDEGRPQIVTVKDLYETVKNENVDKHNSVADEIERKITDVEKISSDVSKNTILLNSLESMKEKIETEISLNIVGIEDLICDDPDRMLSEFNLYLDEFSEYEKVKMEYEAFFSGSRIKDEDTLKQMMDESEQMTLVRLARWSDFIEENPGLPEIDSSQDSGKLSMEINILKNSFERFELKVYELENEKSRISSDLGRLQGADPVNIAQMEIIRDELIGQIKEEEFELRVCVKAYKELNETISAYRESYKELLEEKATGYLKKITGKEHRKILFENDFSLIVTEHGRKIDITGLSRGTRDQLYISLRLGLADLLSDSRFVPVVFDDSFTGTDRYRLEKIYEIVKKEASHRQIFILSHSEIYRNWGNKIEELEEK